MVESQVTKRFDRSNKVMARAKGQKVIAAKTRGEAIQGVAHDFDGLQEPPAIDTRSSIAGDGSSAQR